MSFRSNGSHHPSVPPRRHRRNSIQGLITNNRPRSIAGLYSSNGSNPYSSTYSSGIPSSTYGSSIPSYGSGYSSPYMNYNSYSSPYNSANSSSYYGGLTPSYNSKAASISSMLNSLNLSKPLSSYAVVPSNTTNYGNKDSTITNSTRQSRAKSRHDKYNRDRSLSRASSNIDSKSSDIGGSRSISLTSLESQGYVVRFCFIILFIITPESFFLVDIYLSYSFIKFHNSPLIFKLSTSRLDEKYTHELKMYRLG